MSDPSPIKCRVLIVDDNRDSADTLGRLLEIFGHEVRVVYDGESCINTVVTFRPDAVLLDLDMPGMNGFEVASRLRSDPGRYGSALVVAITGRTPDDRDRRVAEIGLDYHLIKPVTTAQLRRVISDSMDRKAGSRRLFPE
jgi:two-component system, sensor histidine kinase